MLKGLRRVVTFGGSYLLMCAARWHIWIYRRLFARQTPTKYIKKWKRTHERQENKRGKAEGEQEIRRESPGEHK